MELSFPVKGKHVGFPSSKQPQGTTRDLNNVRPYYDGRLAGGQRPGADKRYAEQIAGVAGPVVAICSVATVST